MKCPTLHTLTDSGEVKVDVLLQNKTIIYAECSIDYDANSETTKTFFAEVQNKLHWAITGKIAVEIIVSRADY